MASLTDIFNDAFALLGDGVVNSAASTTARTATLNALWPGVRDRGLKTHPFNCAIRRATVAVHGTGADHFTNSFRKPTKPKCLRVLRVGGPGSGGHGRQFSVEGNLIHAYADGPAEIVYIGQIEPEDMDADVAAFLAALLASSVVPNRTKSNPRDQLIKDEVKRRYLLAITSDGAEGFNFKFEDSYFIMAREGYDGGEYDMRLHGVIADAS